MLQARASSRLLVLRRSLGVGSASARPTPAAAVQLHRTTPTSECALHGRGLASDAAAGKKATHVDRRHSTDQRASSDKKKPTKAHWRAQPHRPRNAPQEETPSTTGAASPIGALSRRPRTSSPPRRPSDPSQATRPTLTRSQLDAQPKINIGRALEQLIDLSEAGSPSAVGAAVSATVRRMRPERVPAELQVGIGDDLLRAFDPTPRPASASSTQAELAFFLDGRSIIAERGHTRGGGGELDLAGDYQPTVDSGRLDSRYDLDPDVVHALDGLLDDSSLVPGRTDDQLADARKSSIQLSLSSLITTAAEYHVRAVERDDALRSVTASPLAPRTRPNVSARSESSHALKTRELREMEAVFEVLEARAYPRTLHWTVMLSAYGREGFVADAEEMFAAMIESGMENPRLLKVGAFFPDVVTCNAMLGVYAQALKKFPHTQKEREGVLEKARGIFRTMGQHRIQKDIVTYTSMLSLLGNELVVTPTPLQRTNLLKEAIELFEYMQMPAGGSLYPNRRTFSVMSQAFAAAGDHIAARTMLESMVRTHALFPSLAVMNGLLKATAYGCARMVPMSTDSDKPPVCDIEPLKEVIRLMKAYRLDLTEHSVASIISGLAQAGQVQTAKDLHDHLADGSLGTARPSRLTYTALLSSMLKDHAQPMSSVLATFERGLTDGSFKSPAKRKGTMLDMRVLGNHPELYPVALTRQLRQLLDRYMQLSTELLAQRAAEAASNPKAARPSAERDERTILDQVVPERGWLVLTGRHQGDAAAGELQDQLTIGDTIFDGHGQLSLPGDHSMAGLVDEFPDDGDYSAFDDTGEIARAKADEAKRKKMKGPSPSPREASKLNSDHSIAPTTSYGQIASKFLLSQTPSLQAILTHQFDKTGPGGAASVKSAYPEAEEEGVRVRRPPVVVPKTGAANEGMLIVRRPAMHFWLRCHAHVLNWHAASKASVARGEAASREVPAPPFLPHHQQGGWWRRLSEAIELQHGLASLQTSSEYAHSVEKDERRKEWQRRERKAAGYVGTRRDGTRVEPQMEERQPTAADQEQVPDWSIRRKTQKQRW